MSDISLDDIVWDLEFCDSEVEGVLTKLKSSYPTYYQEYFLFYYLILDYFYKSEHSIRSKALNIHSYNFTTSPSIYRLTGIYAVSFSDNLNGLARTSISGYFEMKSVYSGSSILNSFVELLNFSDIVLYGNTDILYNFLELSSNSYDIGLKSNLVSLQLLEDDDGNLLLGSCKNTKSLDAFHLLSDNVLCSDKFKLFSNFNLNIKYKFLFIHKLQLLYDILSTHNLHINETLYIMRISSVVNNINLYLSLLDNLSSYFNKVVVEISNMCSDSLTAHDSRKLKYYIHYLKRNNKSNIKFKFRTMKFKLIKLYFPFVYPCLTIL